MSSKNIRSTAEDLAIQPEQWEVFLKNTSFFQISQVFLIILVAFIIYRISFRKSIQETKNNYTCKSKHGRQRKILKNKYKLKTNQNSHKSIEKVLLKLKTQNILNKMDKNSNTNNKLCSCKTNQLVGITNTILLEKIDSDLSMILIAIKNIKNLMGTIGEDLSEIAQTSSSCKSDNLDPSVEKDEILTLLKSVDSLLNLGNQQANTKSSINAN